MMKMIAAGAVALATLAGSASFASAQDGTYVRPLTVSPRVARREIQARPVAPVEAYNPYLGPKAIVTAPLALAGTIVALPFVVTDAVFAHTGNTPLAIVGAPVHLAGRIAQAPFQLVQAPFGGPAPFTETRSYY